VNKRRNIFLTRSLKGKKGGFAETKPFLSVIQCQMFSLVG